MSNAKKIFIAGLVLLLLVLVACQNGSNSPTETQGTTGEATTTIETTVEETTTELILIDQPPVMDLTTVELHQFFEENRQVIERIKDFLMELSTETKNTVIIANWRIYAIDASVEGFIDVDIEAELEEEFRAFVAEMMLETGNTFEIGLGRTDGKRVISFNFSELGRNANIVYLPDGTVDFRHPDFPEHDINFTNIEGNWYSWFM